MSTERETPVETNQLKLGSGSFVIKVWDRFGFPSLVALAIGAAWYLQNKEFNAERKELVKERAAIYQKISKQVSRVDRNVRALGRVCQTRPGMVLPPTAIFEEPEVDDGDGDGGAKTPE